MKNKIRVLYILIIVVIVIISTVIMIHRLTASEKGNGQEEIESRLPSGNYLPNAENPRIRVIIKTDGFKQITHSEVCVSSKQGLIIKHNDLTDEAETLAITPEHDFFQTGSIRIEAKQAGDSITIHSLNRGYGTPSYRGVLELLPTAEGIVIVNELPVEEYLYAVVPSEMPASYHTEALKCQAICARSYAYCQMQAYGYPEYYAHVDDSVSYQVYGNSKEQETTTQAVIATNGKKVWYQEKVIKTYYYSTSCGHSTSVAAWGTELSGSNAYLQGVALCDENGNAYEKDLPWYRWETTISGKTLCELIESNTKQEIGNLQNIEITKRGEGGVALQISIKGTVKTLTIETENKIRSALGGSGYEIKKQDGTVIESTKLLPSAFFSIEKNGERYIIKGGGYGHGIGMSQNGANEMAKAGKTHKEILQFFYPGTQVQ